MNNLTADTDLVETYLWIPGALLHLPVGIFAGIIVLELIDSFQKTRENDRAVLSLLILGLVTTLLAAHLGLAMKMFLGDWGNFPFGRLILGYMLGFALLVTWSFKLLARRSWRKAAQMAIKHRMTKHRTSGSRGLSYAYAFAFTVSMALASVCLSYKADFGEVPAYVTLGVPGKAEDLPPPPPPVAPPTPAAPAVAMAQKPSPSVEKTTGPKIAAQADPADFGAGMSAGPDPEPENSEPQPQPMPKVKVVAMAAPADANLTVEFASQVQPILKERCYECHGETKDKGDFRIHTPADIRKGGENGPVIVSGKPNDSPLYFLTTLDPADEDIMPSKGDPLTKEQTEILRTWILEGAYLADGRRAEDNTEVASTGDGGEMAEGDEPPLSTAIVIPNDAYLETIRGDGVLVTKVPDDDFMLEIDYSKARINAGEIDLKVLYPIARNIVSLNLAKSKITESDLEPLRELKNLAHLRLDRTNIGDSALYDLSDLKKLETLNLYGTRVSDSGVNALGNNKKLKELVLMNTLVTPAGAARLQKSLPNAEIQAPE